MNEVTSISKIGYYCGRLGEGFWGEPQNSLSNLVFLHWVWHLLTGLAASTILIGLVASARGSREV